MKINILHLYPDLLNLYGESGNIKILKNYLEFNKIKVNIKECSINDVIDLKNIDLIYVGMGTEDNQSICIKHIVKYKLELEDYIENKGFVLSTGNSIELFGKYIKNDKKIKTLGIFDYYSEVEEVVDQPLYKCDFINEKVIGFINKRSKISNIDNHYLFINERPTSEDNLYEGYHYKNFYGTYLLGPLLVRNPSFLEHFCKNLIESIDNKYELSSNLDLEYKAYNEFIKNYY